MCITLGQREHWLAYQNTKTTYPFKANISQGCRQPVVRLEISKLGFLIRDKHILRSVHQILPYHPNRGTGKHEVDTSGFIPSVKEWDPRVSCLW